MPGPLKEIALQGGLAGVALKKIGFFSLVSSLTSVGTAMDTTATKTGKLSGAFARMQPALRGVAGVGGMLALSAGAGTANKSLGVLASAGGGAMLGFSVAGPWGAAIGAGAGALFSLATQTNKANDAANNSLTTWESYASTLDSVTGATTAATKSMIILDLQKSGLLKKAQALGLSQQTLVDGLYGEKDARAQLSAAIKAQERRIKELEATDWENIAGDKNAALSDELKVRKKNLKALKDEVGDIDKANKKTAERIALLNNIPKAVATKIQTPGAVKSVNDLAQLAAQYKLTPKQIETVIKMSGVKTSTADVTKLKDELIKADKVKPSNAWENAFKASLKRTQGETRSRTATIPGLLKAPGNTKVNMTPWRNSILNPINLLSRGAYGKASPVGYNLGRGMYGGLGTWIQPMQNRAAAMVRGAISAAKVAGGIFSPSRKMRYLGEMLGEGLADGMDRQQKNVRTSAKSLVDSVTGQTARIDMTPLQAPVLGAGPAAVGNVYQITVHAPVGSSSTDIGRELTKHIDAYERAGGRRRA